MRFRARPDAPYLLRLTFALPRALVWERLWDLGRHDRFIPLTAVDPARGSLARPGFRFTARTGVGPLGVDDVMEVRAASTPAHGPWALRVDKLGQIVRGRIEATLTEVGPDRTELTWRQEISISGLPRWLDPLVAGVARRAYARTIRRIVGV